MSLGQNGAVGHGMVIASGQAMLKPGLDGISYGVGPVLVGEAVTLVSTTIDRSMKCAGLHHSESAEQGAVLGGQHIVEGDVLLPDEPGSW